MVEVVPSRKDDGLRLITASLPLQIEVVAMILVPVPNVRLCPYSGAGCVGKGGDRFGE
jgi:hypothetical protein